MMGFLTESGNRQCLQTDRGSFYTAWKNLESDLVEYNQEVMLAAREAVMEQPGTLLETQGDGAYPQTGRMAQAVVASILAKHLESGRFLKIAECVLKRSAELDLEKKDPKGTCKKNNTHNRKITLCIEK